MISIVISNFNRRDDMYRCLWNIYQQNTRDFEVIVVDNASDDGSIEEIEKFPIDKLVVMPHQRFSAMETINIGFTLATRPYTLILDNDAYFMDHTTVSRILTYMQEHPDVGILAMNICNSDRSSQVTILDTNGTIIHPDAPIDYYEFVGACTCFRTDVLRECGYYDESFGIYANEFDLSFKVLHAGYRLVYHPGLQVGHSFSTTARLPNVPRELLWIKNHLEVCTRYFAQPYRTGYVILAAIFYERIHKFSGMYGLQFGEIICRAFMRSVLPHRESYDGTFARMMYQRLVHRVRELLPWSRT